MARVGIMQGRLVPPVDDRIQCFPRNRWAEEFALAALASFDCIEWLYDLESAVLNPLGTDAGIEEIKMVSAAHRVRVLSLCAAYFIDMPLVRAGAELEDRLAVLHRLMRRCQLPGVQRLVLPFLDSSRIESKADIDTVVSVLERSLPVAERDRSGNPSRDVTRAGPLCPTAASTSTPNVESHLRFREQFVSRPSSRRGVCRLRCAGGKCAHQGPHSQWRHRSAGNGTYGFPVSLRLSQEDGLFRRLYSRSGAGVAR